MWLDAAGTRHGPAQADARIVSLVPSLTELLLVLGLGDRVVGRTDYCIHPHERVAGIAKVGGPKKVAVDRVHALAPTHVMVNVDENAREVVESLRAFVPHIVVTHPLQPQDNLALYELFGGLFDRSAAAAGLAAGLGGELAACRATAWAAERVLYLIWKEPWMTVAADTYIAGSLARVGWVVLHGPGGWTGAKRYPVIEDLDAAVAQAERVLLSSEPFRFGERDRRALRARFPGKSIELIDGEMTGWYGARAIEGLRYLRAYRAGHARPEEHCSSD